ncbi:MAG: hypothetical protein A4E53_00252 [Pelotomaculum sp. PtaB.Bin104]|nr:MAG: hypothetical protein A4E53_00252 [Pelotomaculum sp. PtaB.Bin104]
MAKEQKGKGEKSSGSSIVRGRDAKTGQFISVKEAKLRPATTVVETIKKASGDKSKAGVKYQKPPKKK